MDIILTAGVLFGKVSRKNDEFGMRMEKGNYMNYENDKPVCLAVYCRVAWGGKKTADTTLFS